MKLDQEARVTISCLVRRGQSRRQIARILGVSEGTVRYHVKRIEAGTADGRSGQAMLADKWSDKIAHFLEEAGQGPANMAALYDWLVAEHDYVGSLRSVQRYFRRRFPRPARRARRRVETPPGAQAQVDWAEWSRIHIAGQPVHAYEFHLRLSHSRYGVRVWSPRKDQLAWLHVHNEAFRRVDGIPAVVRVDNEKTAVSRGAGPWGEINASYRQYARAVRFHVDPCLPRHPEAKGKVERGIQTDRNWREVAEREWKSWDELQAWTDVKSRSDAERRTCPATGTTILSAWEAEKPHLRPVPLLPEPFNVAVTRPVGADCTVAFEGRRYSVPFQWLGKRIEVRGCNRTVQMVADGHIVAEHPRQGRERIVIDPKHYEGEATDHALPPIPLGRMGRRLQEIAALSPAVRPLDLYAALAEVAR